jgi:choline-sulfatase
VPTLLELCGVPRPSTLQGRSLVPLLRGETAGHREQVFAEYTDNEEAMIRTERWKLIYSTGKRRRQDGYALERPAGGPVVQLYDLELDPDEAVNLADRPGHPGLVRRLLDRLADHLVCTARAPRSVPRSGDLRALLVQCLSPPDVDLYTYLRNRQRMEGP